MKLNKCIQKIYLDNNNKNKKEIPNNKEKINSLLSLVNINNFDKDKLNEYKDSYNNNLKIITYLRFIKYINHLIN